MKYMYQIFNLLFKGYTINYKIIMIKTTINDKILIIKI